MPQEKEYRVVWIDDIIIELREQGMVSCCRRREQEHVYFSADASRGVTAPSREGPLDRRGGPLLECVGCPAGGGALEMSCGRRRVRGALREEAR